MGSDGRWKSSKKSSTCCVSLNSIQSKLILTFIREWTKQSKMEASNKCFNMRESNLDGYQDLNFGTREMEDIVHEIMEDPIKGNHAPAGCTCQCTSRRVQVQKNGRSHGRVMYIPVHIFYLPVHTRMYWYVLVCTVLYLTYWMMHSWHHTIGWLCAPWYQPSSAKQTRVSRPGSRALPVGHGYT